MSIGKLRIGREWLILASLAAVAAAIWACVLHVPQRCLEVTFLDVGQGDCIFIRTPGGRTVLVDGGGSALDPDSDVIGARVTAPFLRREAVNRIDVVVVTHPHDDHVQGLTTVLRDFRVGLVLDAAVPHGSDSYRDLLSQVHDRRIPYKRAARGQVLDFGDGVRAEVLHPPLPRLAGTEEDINNNSVVLRLTYGSSSVLLAGDAGCEAEQAIIASGADIRSDVLKVAHHGSRSASGDAWLDAVQPRVAVISVGRGNSFGHPSRIVLDRLSRRHVTVYRTDRNGAVVVRLSPESFRVDPTQSVPQD